MSHHVVFLDRESLPVPVRRPRDAASYVEFATTLPEQVVPRLQSASVVITNKVRLGAEVISQLPQLRLIAVAATGYDCIDIAACRRQGVAVANVRDYAIHTVSEHVFALVLALRRNLLAYVDDVARGEWQRSTQFCLQTHPIGDLHGSTLGIIGAGAIGLATGALGQAFGMQVCYAQRDSTRDGTVPRLPLRELLAQSDVVSIHCPLTAATRHLIGRDELRLMRRGALLINTARGGIVDESALASALEDGTIAGAGFDVLTQEPPPPEHPLLRLARRNFILTPHVAWSSRQALQALADQLIDNVDAWTAGQPRNLVR